MEMNMEYTYELMTVSHGEHKRYDTCTRVEELHMLHVTRPNYVYVFGNEQLSGTPLFTLASQADLEEWSDARARSIWIGKHQKKPTRVEAVHVVLADTNVKTAAAVGKPTMSYVPPAAFFALGAATEFGAVTKGYGRFNWRATGITASVFYDAMNRHLQDWFAGDDFASDSKIHHLAHLMAGAAIVLDSIAEGKMKDDRQPATPFRKASDSANWYEP